MKADFLYEISDGIFSNKLLSQQVMSEFENAAPAGDMPVKDEGGVSNPEDMEINTNWDECTTAFDAMALKEDLLRGIYAYGFEKPSAIQQRAVKPTLLGRDVIAQAQSGT